MANWCHNEIILNGPNSSKVFEEFMEDYGFDEEVSFRDETTIEFHCFTAWDPQREALQDLCYKWGVECDLKFWEFGMDFSGYATIDTEGNLAVYHEYDSALQILYFHKHEDFMDLVQEWIVYGNYEHIHSKKDLQDELYYVTEKDIEILWQYFLKIVE
jgi:hypothetical protein